MAETGDVSGQNGLDLLRISRDKDSFGSRQAKLGKCSLSGWQVVQLRCTPSDKVVIVLIPANLVVQLGSCADNQERANK